MVFRDSDPFEMLKRIGIAQMAANVLIGCGYFFSFGFLMRVVYQHHYKQKLSWADTFLIPFMMHTWTYILPVKGGLVFQTFFVKAKYKIDLSKGFSVGVLVFVTSLAITCIFGGLLSFLLLDVLMLQLLLLAMLFGLLCLLIASRYVKHRDNPRSGIIGSLIGFVLNVLAQLREQTKDMRLLLKVFFITLGSTTIHAFWFYHSALILGFTPDIIGITLATLVLRIITLFRVLPGNLGLQEVMIGTVFMAAGLGLDEGLMTALLIRLVSVLLAGTIGMAGLYTNFRYFGTNTFSGLMTKLKQR